MDKPKPKIDPMARFTRKLARMQVVQAQLVARKQVIGANIYVQENAPTNPEEGDIWYSPIYLNRS